MKFAKGMLFSAVLAGVTFAGQTSAALIGPELIINGDFETAGSVPLPTSGGYVTVAGNTNSVFGWTVGVVSIDLVNSYSTIASGGRIAGISIDLLGTPGPGNINQTVYGLTVGTQYELSWGVSTNKGNGAVQYAYYVSTDGSGSQSFLSSLTPTVETIVFTATSANQTMSFNAFQGTNSGPIIDGVSLRAVMVSAVPEPSETIMLLAGLGSVALISRRRRSK
jgi:Protein of unknown function (DUF642)